MPRLSQLEFYKYVDVDVDVDENQFSHDVYEFLKQYKERHKYMIHHVVDSVYSVSKGIIIQNMQQGHNDFTKYSAQSYRSCWWSSASTMFSSSVT